MDEIKLKKSRSLLPVGLILLFGGFAVNTIFLLAGIHGYLRELSRFTTIAGLALTIIALFQWLWRLLAAWLKKKV
ncbi:MAG: hypothetical protein AB1439_06895 [candidate division FCPU426 bacterium]